MAIQIIREISDRSGTWDQDTNHRYTRTFLVYTDDPNDGSATIHQSAGTPPPLGVALPVFGDNYRELAPDGVTVKNEDEDSRCVERRVEMADAENNFQKWIVHCEYVGLTDPTMVPAEIDFSPVPYQKTIIQDLSVNNDDDPDKPSGRMIVNSAGDPYEHGATVDRHRWRLVIVQNILYESWNPVTMEVFNDSTNKYPFLASRYPPGFPAGSCKLVMSAVRVRQSDNQTFYWRRTSTIDIEDREVYTDNNGAVQQQNWLLVIRDCGYNAKDPVSGKKRPIYLPGAPGLTPSSPYLLNGAGQQLDTIPPAPSPPPPPGSPPPTPPPPPQGYVNVFVGYRQLDWSNLGLEYWNPTNEPE